MFLRHLTGFRSHTHGRNSMGVLQRSSNTNLAESSPRVSTSLLLNFHAFRLYSFQKRGPPNRNGIQVIATLDPNKFAEKGQQRLHIGNLMYYGTHISLLKTSSPVKAKHLLNMTWSQATNALWCICPSHQARKPSCITSHRLKNPHRGRTTSPSCIKWSSCVFREWVGPLANKWSAKVSSALFSYKISSCSVWETEGRTTCFRRPGHSFIDFALQTTNQLSPDSSSLFIKWHIYRRFRYVYWEFPCHYRTRRGGPTIPSPFYRCSCIMQD